MAIFSDFARFYLILRIKQNKEAAKSIFSRIVLGINIEHKLIDDYKMAREFQRGPKKKYVF